MKVSFIIASLMGWLTVSSVFTQGANILFVCAISTYSHRIAIWPLVEALVAKGHNVTFIQGFENKKPHPKVKDLVIQMTQEIPNFLDLRYKMGPLVLNALKPIKLISYVTSVCEATFSTPEIMEWINTQEKVDLVMIDTVWNEFALGLAHKFKAEVGVFSTSTALEWWADDFAYPTEDHWIPTPQMSLEMPLSFLRRVWTSIYCLYFRFVRLFVIFPKCETILRKKLTMPDMPSLHELMLNVSLALMNTHFSEELARSTPPMVVPVGGMQCKDKSELEPIPADLANFANSSPTGFILVSFGSEAKIHNAPETVKNAFFNAFRKMNDMRFIWKWNAPRPDEMPDNVLTTEWVPQQSILAHPKIKAFVTHGGLLSMQEALYHKVPMISFPVFAEQDFNAQRLHRMKRGIMLEITTVTEQEIEDAIKAVLTDPIYKNNVEKASQLFQDRPEHPTKTALWWVEYLLRHKGEAKEVLTPGIATNQYWFQRRSLDVWAFILGVAASITVLTIYVIKRLICKSYRLLKISEVKKVKKQ